MSFLAQIENSIANWNHNTTTQEEPTQSEGKSKNDAHKTERCQ
jgi:hypothetical protein